MLKRGFACILAKWFWPTEISLSFTYGSPEASCNKRADTYLGRRSASLMKEFWQAHSYDPSNYMKTRLFSTRRNFPRGMIVSFCLLTPTLRQLVFKQQKMSLRAENSALTFRCVPCVKIKDTDDVRFTHLRRRPASPVMVIIPLNFARCTLPTHRNR